MTYISPTVARLANGVEFVCGLFFGFSIIFSASSGAAVSTSSFEAQDLLAKKKWAEAVIVLRAEVSREPQASGAQVDLARALLYLGRREEALSVLEQASRKEKGPKKVWLTQQIRVFSKTFMTNSTFQLYQDGLNLLQTQKYKLAREKFEKALALEPSNVEIITRIGQSYLLDGDHDSAAERLKLARGLNPYEPEIRLWLGRALHLRGEMDDAILELKSASIELGKSEIAPIWIADALEAAGQKNLALQSLEEDSKANPLHVMSLVNAAKLKVQMADQNSEMLWSARKDFQNALSRLPDYFALNRAQSEGELGLGYPIEEKEFHDEVQASLQKVQIRLEELDGSEKT